MVKEIMTFGHTAVEKHKFHLRKSPISIHDVTIDRIVVSSEFPFGTKGFKYFIGYKGGKKS